MAAERQIGVDALLEGGEPELLEPGDLALARTASVAKLGQRLPAPERERLAQAAPTARRGSSRSRASRDQRSNRARSSSSGSSLQEITGRARPDPLGAEQLAQRSRRDRAPSSARFRAAPRPRAPR